MKTQDMNRNRW